MEERLEELTVERLNVVGKDGKPRVVISNEDRAPEPVIDGKELKRQGGGAPGLIFYNQRGDECGGLIYGSDEDGTQGGAIFTFDQVRNDQVLALRYAQDGERRSYGLILWERPLEPKIERDERREAALKLPEGPQRTAALDELGPGGSQRMFLGRTDDGTYQLMILDKAGRPRISLGVGEDDEPRIQFLDAEGNVTYSLPPQE